MLLCFVFCVLCFLDAVRVVLYVHYVLPLKTPLRGGACVWNCGPGLSWDPFKISRSLATIPRVIIGRAYIGCFGGIWVRVLGLAHLFGASSPAGTTSLTAIHACLCSAVMRVVISHTPCRSRIGGGDVGSMRQYFAGTVHCHASEVFSPLHDIPPSDSEIFVLLQKLPPIPH